MKLDEDYHPLRVSAEILAQGPLVVTFYRGVWCPYCNIELQALQADHKALEANLALLGKLETFTTASTTK